MSVTPVELAVIGGSGLYQVEGLTVTDRKKLSTPFGEPSGEVVIGHFNDGHPIAFLPRHDKGHRLLPGEINSRANIWALKSLGVKQIISISAVGSLQQEVEPRHFIIPDQIIDRTRGRQASFFGEGIVGHVGFADPFCPHLSRALAECTRAAGVTVHEGGTYLCMEGPAFSTRAESKLYRSWGARCIGMTALPEAKLAREAEICYATAAMATDYDCWHEGEAVTLEMILAVMNDNVQNSQTIVRAAARNIFEHHERFEDCACRHAATGAIVTDKSVIPAATRKKVDLLFGKYL